MVALIEEQLSETERSATLEALVKAGAPDKSLKGVLKSALKKLGEKIADDAGEAVADEVASYLGPLMDSSKSEIISAFRSVFSKPASKSTRD